MVASYMRFRDADAEKKCICKSIHKWPGVVIGHQLFQWHLQNQNKKIIYTQLRWIFSWILSKNEIAKYIVLLLATANTDSALSK